MLAYFLVICFDIIICKFQIDVGCLVLYIPTFIRIEIKCWSFRIKFGKEVKSLGFGEVKNNVLYFILTQLHQQFWDFHTYSWCLSENSISCALLSSHDTGSILHACRFIHLILNWILMHSRFIVYNLDFKSYPHALSYLKFV